MLYLAHWSWATRTHWGAWSFLSWKIHVAKPFPSYWGRSWLSLLLWVCQILLLNFLCYPLTRLHSACAYNVVLWGSNGGQQSGQSWSRAREHLSVHNFCLLDKGTHRTNGMHVYAAELICSTGVSGFQTSKHVFCIYNKQRLQAEILSLWVKNDVTFP